jgi:uncharacterized peroxidase-related enzyme
MSQATSSQISAPQAVRQTSGQADEPISRLSLPEETELPAHVRQIFVSFRTQYGFVPNWLRALAVNPDTAYRLVQFYEHLFSDRNSHLTKPQRELIAVVASATNHCSYCVFNHAQALGVALDDKIRAQRIAQGHHHVQLSETEQALAEITEQLTTNATAIGADGLQRLRKLGFSEQAVLEVLEIGAFFNYANRLTIALNVVPDREFFA